MPSGVAKGASSSCGHRQLLDESIVMSDASLQLTVRGFENDGEIMAKVSWAAVRYLEGLHEGPQLGPKA